MRNLNEEMALFSIKIERIKYNALTKLSALQDELSQPTEREKEAKRAAREYGLAGLAAMSPALMNQYALLQARGAINDQFRNHAALGQLQTGRDANWL